MMLFAIIILFFSVNFFESLKFSVEMLSDSITAAETTEPTRLPLPTSSTPAIIFLIASKWYII